MVILYTSFLPPLIHSSLDLISLLFIALFPPSFFSYVTSFYSIYLTHRLSEAYKLKWVKRVAAFFKCSNDGQFVSLGRGGGIDRVMFILFLDCGGDMFRR